MSTQPTKYELRKIEQAGRLLAARLQEARKKQGVLCCPVCQKIFEGTHLLKCPVCRTLINKSFREIHTPKLSEKMELDFFSAPAHVGESCEQALESAISKEEEVLNAE